MNDKKINIVISPRGYGKCYKEYKNVIDYLENEIEKLKGNWNSLREYVEKLHNKEGSWAGCGARYVLDKMNELEGRDKK